MKGNERGFRPVSYEWQQVNARVAEINMQQIRIATAENAVELVVFSPIEDRLQPLNVFPMKAQEKVDAWTRQDLDIRKGETIGVLPQLGHHERPKLPQSRNLPVDMLHLALEKRTAVAGDDGLRHEVLQQIAGRRVRQADFMSRLAVFMVK